MVEDSNSLFKSKKPNVFERYRDDQLSKKRGAFFVRLAIYIYTLLMAVLRYSRAESDKLKRIEKNKTIYVYETQNQKRALSVLYKEDKEKHTLSFHHFYSADSSLNEVLPLILGLISLPYYVIYFLFFDFKHRILIDKYLISFGYYLYFRFFLPVNVTNVVVANDHTERLRAFAHACKTRSIKITYVQHSPVNSAFPPLNLYDISMLDGQSSLDTYMNTGPVLGEVILSGAIRNFFLKTDVDLVCEHDRKTFGIGINTLVDVKKLTGLVGDISNKHPDHKVIIRLHPSQMKEHSMFSSIFDSELIHVSGAWEQSTMEFINTIDVLFAGSSSIHLDALAAGVLAVMVDIDTEFSDYYLFQQRGCVIAFCDFLNLDVSRYTDVCACSIDKARYYDFALGMNSTQQQVILKNCLNKIKENKSPQVL
ncbi:hypothetical protein [Corallincola luteus]|uniref:hypothetical protein n=1 Tax=Corallincola luteus TaxID=1775177 RepID=UPI00196B468E|nr:hypothetical protein [Corallincola luteus]